MAGSGSTGNTSSRNESGSVSSAASANAAVSSSSGGNSRVSKSPSMLGRWESVNADGWVTGSSGDVGVSCSPPRSTRGKVRSDRSSSAGAEDSSAAKDWTSVAAKVEPPPIGTRRPSRRKVSAARTRSALCQPWAWRASMALVQPAMYSSASAVKPSKSGLAGAWEAIQVLNSCSQAQPASP